MITPDFALPVNPTDHQINLALLHLRYPSSSIRTTESGHVAFSIGSRNMTHNINYALPADGFQRTADNLRRLKEETELNFIWDPLNDPHQAREMADATVTMSMSSWDKSALYGTWGVVYPGAPLVISSLRESEIYLERRHQGRDLRRAACEAFLLSNGWRS